MVMTQVTYLEMLSPDELKPAQREAAFSLMRAQRPNPAFVRFLYAAVGAQWKWHTRLSWSYAMWMQHLNRDSLEIWVAYLDGSPIGYFELDRQSVNTEILYFGLFPEVVGQGHGGPLLSAAIRRAWECGTQRVWVHTCNLDHHLAIANYEARGFKVYQVLDEEDPVADYPLEPWPGADMPLLQEPH